MMLKEKYYDENGLKENHPSIHQFKYIRTPSLQISLRAPGIAVSNR